MPKPSPTGWLLGSLARRPVRFWTFAGLILLAAVSFVPDFRDTVVPCHDARLFQSAYHVLQAGIVHENGIPQWLPYGRYGTDGFVLTMYVSPVGYAAAVLGKLLSITRTMDLFKVVMLGQFLLFTVGSLRLSALLYDRLSSIVLVNVGAILSFTWLGNLDSNFLSYYLLPHVLYFMIRFFREGRVRDALVAGLFAVFSAVGNYPYYLPLLTLLLVIFCGAFVWSELPRLPRLKVVPSDAAWLAGLVLVTAAFLCSYFLNLQDLAGFHPGRDPERRKVLLEVFLTYAGVTKLDNLFLALATGVHTHGDNTYYVGLATPFLAAVALAKCRRSDFTAIATLQIFLVLFSMGGFVATAAYYFPGMSYYRHIGMIFGPARYLLLLMAGFGLDHLLRDPSKLPGGAPRPTWKARWNLRLAAAGLILIECARSLRSTVQPWAYELFPRGLEVMTSPAALRMTFARTAVYLVALGVAFAMARRRAPPRKGLWSGALLAAFLVDMASFKIVQFQNWPELDPATAATARDAFTARPALYRPVRVSGRAEEDRNETLKFLATQGPIRTSYASVYAVSGVDPSIPIHQTHALARGVESLLRARQIPFEMFPTEKLLRPQDEWLFRALGIHAPKLRLFRESEVEVLPAAACFSRIKSLPLDSDTLVVEGDSEGPRPRSDPSPAPFLGEVSVREFASGRLVVEASIPETESAWLYYADAFHPGWNATVNGGPANISRANLGFKAIRLGPGRNRVELRFWHGWGSTCSYFLGGASVLFVIGLGIWIARSVGTWSPDRPGGTPEAPEKS
jgi:hypothetical protein